MTLQHQRFILVESFPLLSSPSYPPAHSKGLFFTEYYYSYPLSFICLWIFVIAPWFFLIPLICDRSFCVGLSFSNFRIDTVKDPCYNSNDCIFFIWPSITLLCMYQSLFIQSSIHGHLYCGYLQILAIKKLLEVLSTIFPIMLCRLLEYLPKVEMLGQIKAKFLVFPCPSVNENSFIPASTTALIVIVLF